MSSVAFLRAVNVGGRMVKMDRLRAVFEGLRFREVSTFIASGNVLFKARGEAAALERRIERALAEAFGFEVTTFVRGAVELCDAVRATPFAPAEGESLMVGFLKVPPTAADAARVLALQTPDDELAVRGRELWWLRRGRISDTKLAGGLLEKTVGGPMTIRNVTTVTKLVGLVRPAGGAT